MNKLLKYSFFFCLIVCCTEVERKEELKKPSDEIRSDLVVKLAKNEVSKQQFKLDKYQNVVMIFYEMLNSSLRVTIRQYQDLFGDSSLEEEEYFFFERCDTLRSRDACRADASQVLFNPNSESLAFIKVRSIEDKLSLGDLKSTFETIQKSKSYSTYSNEIK